MRTQPSASGVTKSGKSGRSARGGNRGSIAEEGGDDRLAFLGLERADRIDQRAAGLQPVGGAVEQPRLQLGAAGDDLRAGAVEHFGMAAEGAGRRAGRVEQDRVEAAVRAPR